MGGGGVVGLRGRGFFLAIVCLRDKGLQPGHRRVPLGALTNRVNANNTRHGKDKDNVDKKADSVVVKLLLSCFLPSHPTF